MEWTILQDNLQRIEREASQDTILHCSLETFLYRRDEFLRNVTTLHFVDKLQATLFEVFINRTNSNDDISKLTTTTRLFLINFTQFYSLSNSLLVVNLRTTLVTFYLELTFQTVDNDIQVKLTHTRDNCLTTLFVCTYSKCRVFFSQFSQTVRQFIQVFLSLRLYSDTNNRFREFHRFQYNRSCFITQSITSTDIFETYTSTNITSTNYFYRILFVWVHLEQTRNTFFLTRASIKDIRTSFYLTRINTEESQTSYVWVCSDLKCQCWSFFIFRRLTIFFSSSVRICTDNIRSIHRRRQESTNIVKQCLNTLVLERRTTEHRNDIHLQSTCTQCTQDFFFCNSRRIVKVFFHQSFVELSYFFQHLITPFLSFVNQVCRDFFYIIVSTHCFIVPQDSFHLDQVNNTLESFFCTNRNYHRTWISAQNILHLANYFKEVSTRTVHLVYITNTRYIIFVSLTPYCFWLRFNTAYSTICSNSTIQYTQRTFYLSSKVNVSRSVDQVDFIFITSIVPVSSSSSRCNSNTTFLLLFHPVHSCSTIVNFTNFVSQTSVKQDTFRSSCFTSIDVRHDTDVTGQMQIMFSHFIFLNFKLIFDLIRIWSERKHG